MVFNEKLEKLGNTPIAEPEIFEALDEKPLKRSKVLKLAGLTDAEINSVSAMEMAEFFNALEDHVAGYKLPDGTYKSTPSTESFTLPTFMEAEQIEDKVTAMATATDPEARFELVKELDEMIWGIVGLNRDNLTDWEQGLIAEQVFSCVTDVFTTSVGKPLPTSPAGGISIPKS